MFQTLVTRAMGSDTITQAGVARLIAAVDAMSDAQRITFIQSALRLGRSTQDQRSGTTWHIGSLQPSQSL